MNYNTILNIRTSGKKVTPLDKLKWTAAGIQVIKSRENLKIQRNHHHHKKSSSFSNISIMMFMCIYQQCVKNTREKTEQPGWPDQTRLVIYHLLWHSPNSIQTLFKRVTPKLNISFSLTSSMQTVFCIILPPIYRYCAKQHPTEAAFSEATFSVRRCC